MRVLNMKKGLLLIFILVLCSFALSAYPLQSYDHDENPAYLSLNLLKSNMDRKYVEWGFSTNVSVGNSYFSLNDIFQEHLVIDFTDMSAGLRNKPLDISAAFSLETHFVISVMKVSAGLYTNVDGVVSTGIPNNLIEILGEGLDLVGQDYEGSHESYGRIFVKSGLYGGYQWKDWQFSGKFGSFVPVLYVDENSSYSYNLTSDNGDITAELMGNFALYMPVDPENIDPAAAAAGLTGMMGYNLDLGAVRFQLDEEGNPERALYGFSLTGITLAPAYLNYRSQMTVSGDLTLAAVAGFEEGDEMIQQQFSDPEFSTVEGDFQIFLPIRAGGFYNYDLIGLIDLVGTAGLTWDKRMFLDLDVTAVGSFFPLNMVYVGLGYDKVLWEGSAGLRLNARAVELGVDVGLASSRLGNLFAASGVSATVYTAFGF